MKARESVKNYPSDRRMSANYAARGAKKAREELGPRFSGTDAEKKGVELAAKELETGCDDVFSDSFSVRPKAFSYWIPLAAILAAISSAAFFLGRFFKIVPLFYVSLVLAAAAALFVVSKSVFRGGFPDFLFSKKTSGYAYGVRKASGETKRRIIFAGGVDSAPERRFTRLGGRALSVFITGGGVLGIVFALAADAAVLAKLSADPDFISSKSLAVPSYILLGFVVFFFASSFFYDKKRAEDGDGYGFSSCFIALAVLKFMSGADLRLENADVAVLCAGSEKIGSKGFKAFLKTRGGELSDVETVFVRIGDARGEYAAFGSKNDAGALELLREGAKIAGFDLPCKATSSGASRAAAVPKGKPGIKAVSLASAPPARESRRSGRAGKRDDGLKSAESGLDICLETAFLYDEKGLNVR